MLELYVSTLDEDVEKAEVSSDEEDKRKRKPKLVSRRRSRSRSPKSRSSKKDEIEEANAVRARLGLKPLEE